MARSKSEILASPLRTWFQTAAEHGDPVGENALGHLYYPGEGVSRDYRQAAGWLLKAAELCTGAGRSRTFLTRMVREHAVLQ
jgi:TPR repeat protein